MNTYLMLFRGINVGGKNILPMKELSLLLEEAGFQNISTYIQSGNVILQSNVKPTADIATAIESKYGFKPTILILEKSEFKLVVKNNPYKSVEGKLAHCYFCSDYPKPNFDKMKMMIGNSEEYKLHGKAFYVYAPDGIGRSKLVANIESCLGVSATGRNLNTLNKLAQLLENTES